jgi:hypothetical protein
MGIANVVCSGFGPDAAVGGIVGFGFISGNPPVSAPSPNPRRTLTPENGGYAGGNFDDITPFETDTFTFDLIDRLSAFGQPPSETITGIEAFGLTAVVGIDGNAASRAVGIATIGGTQVSQKFGGFLQGAIRYRIFVRVTTSAGNVISNWSYFWVRMPGFA